MAIQTTPHTQAQTEVDADSIDMDTAENPQPYDVGNDAQLDGDTDGAQTAGPRSFHVNGGSGLPKEVSEGTADIGADSFDLPRGSGNGITNAKAGTERENQEKVTGK